jgi:hypothetical protein
VLDRRFIEQALIVDRSAGGRVEDGNRNAPDPYTDWRPSWAQTCRGSNMLAIARVMAVLGALAGCGLPMPPNATPCERAPGTQECQIWMTNRMGA